MKRSLVACSISLLLVLALSACCGYGGGYGGGCSPCAYGGSYGSPCMAPTSYAYSVPAPGYATPAPAPGTAYRTNPAPAPGNTYGANPAPNPDANPYGTAPAVPAPGGTYGDDSGNQPGSTAYGRGPGGGEQVPAGDVVTVRDHAYSPQTLNVRVGTTVHWKNQDDVAHSATGDGFDVEIPAGGEGSFTFSKAGTFDVKCRYHETMHGKVVVK